MIKKCLLTFVFCISIVSCFAQKKIDTDSLLSKTNELLKTSNNYKEIIKLCHLGLKNAPDYLDYHVNLGRAYNLTNQADSTRYHFNYVLERNKKYKEVYIYLTNFEIAQGNYQTALTKINEAENSYPNDKEIEFQKAKILLLFDDTSETKSYIESLLLKYPDDPWLKEQLIQYRLKEKTDLVGLNYSYTTFDRSGIGPWHLITALYSHQGKKISIAGMLNYAQRMSYGELINEGLQYELESYFKHSSKSYSMANIAASNGRVFPEFRVAYSYFQGLKKGWEPEIGARFTKTTHFIIYTGVLGVTKYVGSYWLNLRSFWQYDQNKIYPAAQFTARYYFDTKYDYATAFLGYGTSPDERETIGQFDQRYTLSSYRAGLGYRKLFGAHYIAGISASLNRQQYNLDNFQNEYTISIVLQYKF